jgi:succinyl-CoA synthetase beta subunit
VPRGQVAFNSKEAYVIARKFGGDYRGKFVIKAQVQCLQRSNGLFKSTGLRGGVHTVDSVEDVVHFAEKMCGKFMFTPLMTHMAYGYLCNSVLVYEMVDISREFFLKIDYDYNEQKPKITYSSRGGMALSVIQKRYPDTIHHIFIDPKEGLNL